jgi:hypothetical protein
MTRKKKQVGLFATIFYMMPLPLHHIKKVFAAIPRANQI